MHVTRLKRDATGLAQAAPHGRNPSANHLRRFWGTILAGIATAILFAGHAGAQQPDRVGRFIYPQPDCRLARKAYDNPVSDSWGWTMRRWQWHAGYAVASAGISEVLTRTTRMSPMTAAITTTALIGLGPHIRGGLLQQRYAINPRDWVADLVVRSLPIWIAAMRREHGVAERVATAAAFATAYTATACWSSP